MVRKLTWNTRRNRPSSPKDGVKRTGKSPENTDLNTTTNIRGNKRMEQINYGIYYGQVTCIDRQIAELEARKDALLNGYCFTGVYIPNETIIVEEGEENERGSNETEYHSK